MYISTDNKLIIVINKNNQIPQSGSKATCSKYWRDKLYNFMSWPSGQVHWTQVLVFLNQQSVGSSPSLDNCVFKKDT